jgi:predicted nucleic acid-binding protein
MRRGSASLFPKVFDASSLIEIERAKRIKSLRSRRDEVIFPRPVANEIARWRSPLKKFIEKYPEVIRELSPTEQRRYLELRRDPNIDKGEAAAIAMAESRGYPLVIDDKRAKRKAEELGIRCLGWREFVTGAV